jgi:DNA repair exonuclease SbcCD ATPase subunit
MIDDHRGYSAIRIDDRRAHPDIHEGPRMRGAPHPHPAVLEEELELQEHELRRLLAHNRALAEERADLNRELQAGKDEVRHLNVIISDITAEKEAYISKLVDKKRKLEAELRANEHLRDEVVQLRGEIEKLIAARKELSAEAASLMEDLTRERSVKHQLPMLKAELEGLQQELIHARYICSLFCIPSDYQVLNSKPLAYTHTHTQQQQQQQQQLSLLSQASWGRLEIKPTKNKNKKHKKHTSQRKS